MKGWEGDQDIEYWRDLWMFAYLCNGINFRDMLFLKYKNIIDEEIVFSEQRQRYEPLWFCSLKN